MADFVAIDFETANEKRESACALGIAEVKNSEIVATRSWLIRPPDEHFKIRKRNREIHKLGRADLKNQLKFDGLWPTIASYFENRIIVAHNAVSFDIDVLRKLFDYFSIKPPEFKYLCTLELAQASWHDSLTSYDLAQIADFLGCQFSHHDPKDDATVCASFLIRACNDANVETAEELAESIGIDISPFSLIKQTSRGNHGGEGIYGLSISLAEMSASTDEVQVGDVDSNDDPSERSYGDLPRKVFDAVVAILVCSAVVKSCFPIIAFK